MPGIIEAIGQYDPHKTQEQQIPDMKLPEWEVFSRL
jgi:ribosomal protein S16